jgi:ketosteroid isomerase-like protein
MSLADLEGRLRRLEDEQAVIGTMNRYGHALDYGDTAVFLDCFTAGGVWEAPRVGRFEGQERLAHFFAWHTHAPAKYHKHLLVEPKVSLSGDVATVVSYWVRLDTQADGPFVASFGRYLDRLERCADGVWRFSERIIEAEASRPRPDFLAPDDPA